MGPGEPRRNRELTKASARETGGRGRQASCYGAGRAPGVNRKCAKPSASELGRCGRQEPSGRRWRGRALSQINEKQRVRAKGRGRQASSDGFWRSQARSQMNENYCERSGGARPPGVPRRGRGRPDIFGSTRKPARASRGGGGRPPGFLGRALETPSTIANIDKPAQACQVGAGAGRPSTGAPGTTATIANE